MPVLMPYMISRAWILSSIICRQALIRSRASAGISTASPSRAMRTSLSTVKPEPSRTIVISLSFG